MRNPFVSPDDVSPDDEAVLQDFFAPLAVASMSTGGVGGAQHLLTAALLSGPEPRDWGPVARRVAIALASVAAPLATVGAVGAMTGNDVLAKPVTIVASVASHVVHGDDAPSRPVEQQAPASPPPPPLKTVPTPAGAVPPAAVVPSQQGSAMAIGGAPGTSPANTGIPSWALPFNIPSGAGRPQGFAGSPVTTAKPTTPVASATEVGRGSQFAPGNSGDRRQDGAGSRANATPSAVDPPGNNGGGNGSKGNQSGRGTGTDGHGNGNGGGYGQFGHGNGR